MIDRPENESYVAFETPRPDGVTSTIYALQKMGGSGLEDRWPKDKKPTEYPVEVTCYLLEPKGKLASGTVHTIDDENFDRLTWDKLAYASACANLAELRNNTKG